MISEGRQVSGRNHAPCGSSRQFIREGAQEQAEPVSRRGYIIVEEGDDLGVALDEATITGTAETGHWFDDVACTIVVCDFASFAISFRVIYNEDLVRRRAELCNRREASLKQDRAVSRTNDNGDSFTLC